MSATKRYLKMLDQINAPNAIEQAQAWRSAAERIAAGEDAEIFRTMATRHRGFRGVYSPQVQAWWSAAEARRPAELTLTPAELTLSAVGAAPSAAHVVIGETASATSPAVGERLGALIPRIPRRFDGPIRTP